MELFWLVISQNIWSDFVSFFTSEAVFWKFVESYIPQMQRKYENQPKCTATFSKLGFHTPSTWWEQPTNTTLQTAPLPVTHHKNRIHKNHNLLFNGSLSSSNVVAHTLKLISSGTPPNANTLKNTSAHIYKCSPTKQVITSFLLSPSFCQGSLGTSRSLWGTLEL